jgi:hypothetical protein
MPQKIKATGIDRDEKFGIFRKRIQAPNISSFETPTKSLKNIQHIPQNFRVNEIVRRITPEIVESIYNGQYKSPQIIRNRFLPDKLNLTIFHLTHEVIPTKPKIRTIVNYLYACSQSTLFLPTVKTALFKEGNKISDKRFQDYMEMMEHMITTTETTGNRLAFIGTVPLIAPKFTRKLVNMYLDKGITAFAIDCGTRDFLNHVAEFRTILSEISQRVPLEKAFIYACNLGIPRYEANRARADDFLSILAYVDALGTNFKPRGGSPTKGERRAKQFVKEHLFYKVSNYSDFCHERNMTFSEAMRFLPKFNLVEQLNEANEVRKLVGKERIDLYLDKKKGIDENAKKRLGSIAETIKIT